MNNQDLMLRIRRMTKVFFPETSNERIALNRIDLDLKKGEFITVLGSNGSGKTTLFNAVCGTVELEDGIIILDNEDITWEKEHKRALHISRIFQDPQLGTAPDLTIAENLALAYTRKASPSLFPLNKKDYKYFRKQLSMLGMDLELRMNTKIGLLSGGQRQAVSLVMEIISQPKLLLLDEHTAALDPQTSSRILEVTNKFVRESGVTTMMITHNVKDALENGDRTIVFNEGKIINDYSGDERKKLDPYDLQALYG
ncbi:MAG TPA: ATP-binding cassette domain-containing protein [Candidatus Eisenbacteria bacterium]|nr:ATP-binding cassette domain-containing protein [Candidatus Eisenbacteria bacterium]